MSFKLTSGTIAQSQNFLLNTYGDAAAAYSLRRLSSTYSGPLIRVRRSGDSAVLDIYPSGLGLDTQAIINFCAGGRTGTVITWYDQSGTGKNLSLRTGAPQIFNGTSIQTQNSKPSIFFNGSSSFAATFTAYTGKTKSTYVCASRTGTAGTNHRIIGATTPGINDWQTSAGNTLTFDQATSSRGIYSYRNSAYRATRTYTTGFILAEQIWRDTQNTLRYNTTAVGSEGYNANFNFSRWHVGENDVTGTVRDFLVGYISELVIYFKDMTTHSFGIRNQISQYYSIAI